MHYYFCDTGEELQETYDYLAVLETFLRKPIKRLNPERPFSHYLKIYGNYLPSARMRWCTAQLKLKPFEQWLDEEFPGCKVKSYVAIRADEDREGYISHKEDIEAVYPFKEARIAKEDVYRILEEAGLGLPKYYEWRTRSGCYFCFFQRRSEWVGLKEKHPDLYEKAKQYEQVDPATGRMYTWVERESLIQLEQPERVAEIKAMHAQYLEDQMGASKGKRLPQVFEEALDDENDDRPCLICHL
jgi:3'-phosphoadenosine 5'-phosphosulfate sulfotransferase (PAPS reductase)/FAD synthetase